MKVRKPILNMILAAIIVFSVFSASASSTKVTRQENTEETVNPEDVEYYALIIGVEKFAGIELPDEDHIDDSAVQWYDLLVNNTKNWKEGNIKLILNENATKDKIIDAITGWLDDKEDENDIVLIVFEGHGDKISYLQRKHGHAALLTYNETKKHRLEDRITDKEFDALVDELESKHITIILDSCYSGRMLALRQKGRVILAAGGKYFWCGVDESDALGSGIFSFFLKQGFKGVGDTNNDGWVTPEEAFRYARIPTIITSIYTEFPFIIEWNNKTILWFFQVPRMYDRHPGSIKLYQYESDI